MFFSSVLFLFLFLPLVVGPNFLLPRTWLAAGRQSVLLCLGRDRLRGEDTAIVLAPRHRRKATRSANRPAKDRGRAFERRGGGYRAMLLGDSFGGSLLPRLAEHFARLAYLPDFGLSQEILESERSDVVVMEMVERHLASNHMTRHLQLVACRGGARECE